MNYVTLGKTGLQISRMGFGGIPIQKIDGAGTKVLMQELLARGINYIDTARGYTVSEAFLGEALEGIRDQFVLATKSMSRTKEAMEKDIETSLRNLRTDYIDLYQVHNPTKAQLAEVMAPGGALEALQAGVKAGKIGHLGVTAHSAEVFEQALDCEWVETIMFPYNIVETQGEELIARCKERNIGFIAMKPLAGGAIEDADLALRFVCANPNVSVVIPGMFASEEIKQNCDAVEKTEALTAQELTALDEVRRQLGTNFCRRCNYCQPCTAGINISGAFLFEGYMDRYGLAQWARDRYATLPVKAGACVDCGLCEERCPYHLPIRQMLKQCVEKFGE